MVVRHGGSWNQRCWGHHSSNSTLVSSLFLFRFATEQAMVLDTKLNKMQHSAGQLKKLIAGLHHWDKGTGGNTRHDFRAPRKQPAHIRI
jgi:hypothetical protein